MKSGGIFAIGLVVGLVAAKLLIKPDDCCTRVASAVRDKVGDKLGAGAQTVGDVLGLWTYAPGALTFFGVKP